mmetsp:Transcript_18393/g.45249  ORF Transcript_18393/g.45249 Transcript_18393/m.45249 type:complete len:356 (+) Transcript_18393:37-1104(+)
MSARPECGSAPSSTPANVVPRRGACRLWEPGVAVGGFCPAVLGSMDRSLAEWDVIGAMLFNYASSTGIVSANKLLMRHGFTYATTLTFCHFIFTTIGLLVCARLGVYQVKPLDVRKAARLSFFGMGFVVCSNLSLQYNSVGFYQVMKHMTVAAVVAIEATLYRKFLDRRLWVPLTLIVAGVLVTGATDFQLNLMGTVYATLNILSTAFYQIWCGTLQKSLEANSLQLQLYTAPLSALFIIPVLPLLDNWNPGKAGNIFAYHMTPSAAGGILLTSVLAFCVNISIFMVIGKTSAVTYNVLGHFKTCTLFLVDFLVFGRPVEIRNILGIITTLCGVVWYSQVKLQQTRKTPPHAVVK